ncbi:helix-turn-helix domain-containing protein [Streptococcus pluranimalium]|uniref:helix-turn-helix domain-containing protein n=1 Tax=Streptococcus pluranimalium TaxID=82348 RepID=UPI003F679090
MARNNLGNKEIMSGNIRRHLDELGLSPKEFSRRMNFKYSTVLDWVNGKTYPRIDKIELMANFFGVEKSDLVEEYDPNTTSEPTIVKGFNIEELASEAMFFDGKPVAEDEKIVIQGIIKAYLENKKD